MIRDNKFYIEKCFKTIILIKTYRNPSQNELLQNPLKFPTK